MSVVTTSDITDGAEPARRGGRLRRRLAVAALITVILVVLGVILARLGGNPEIGA